MENKFSKLCPVCNREQFYYNKYNLNLSIKKNTSCKSCSKTGKNNPSFNIKRLDEYRQKYPISYGDIKLTRGDKISKSKMGHVVSEDVREKIRNTLKERCIKPLHTLEGDKKISESKKGKKVSYETKEKMRFAALKRIEKQGRKRGYNLNACKYIDDFNKKMGLNLQHALNGGEVVISGYCLDGYDKEKNIVFEYDETTHHCPSYKLKHNDLIRQQNIINKINPIMFIRYDERNDKLYDTITNQNI